MDIIIAYLSLIWVVSLFSLQRIDRIIDEFYSGVAYYLASHDGVIDKIQLEVISKMPKPGLDSYLKHIIENPGNRKDVKALESSLKFIDRSEGIKRTQEIGLAFLTLIISLVHYFDFSKISIITYFDKDALLFAALFLVFSSSIVIDRFLTRLSDLNWPIKFEIK